MIKKLNNILLGLLVMVLVIGIIVMAKGADNMSASLRYFIIGVLMMTFLTFTIVAWLVSYATKRRREKK